MITVEDVKIRINKIFPSDKWIIYQIDNYFDFPVIWVKFEVNKDIIMPFGYIKIERTIEELERIISKYAILRELKTNRVIRLCNKIVKKTA